MNDRLSQCSMNIYALIVKLIDSGEIMRNLQKYLTIRNVLFSSGQAEKNV